ncbi:MAG: ComEC/Rec2 family competence protein [Flavobacteriaceae bacterium]
MHLPRSILYPFVVLYLLGGVFSYFISLHASFFSLTIVLLLCLFWSLKSTYKKWKSVLLYCSFFCAGVLNFLFYYHLEQQHFLRNTTSQPNDPKLIEILEKRSETPYGFTYFGKLKQWGNQSTTGKVLIYQEKDSLTLPFQVGQTLLSSASFEKIPELINPGAFSYKNYLKNLKIYSQLKLHSKNSVVFNSEKKSLLIKADQLRKMIKSKIDSSALNPESKGVIYALLLAERNAVEPELIDAFAKAGVIHLLALSGLHIGLFVEVFLILLAPLAVSAIGKVIRLVSIVIFLWGFAFFVGFPPSVVRAVTLFSFLTLGRFLQHGKNTFHYTVVSLLLLVLVHPPYLRQVGFQFSFLAVFGILWIHPILQTLWKPNNRIIQKFWQWTTVCLSAQLAVGPLSVYYFHLFTSLFILSNLLIVPFFGLFLFLVLIVFTTILFGNIPEFLKVFFDLSVALLNRIVSWIAQIDPLELNQLYLSEITTISIYVFLFFFILWIERNRFYQFSITLIALIGMLFFIERERNKFFQENTFWVFHNHGESLYGHLLSGVLYYFTSFTDQKNQILNDFSISRPLKNLEKLSIQNFYIYDDFRLYIIDSEEDFIQLEFNPSHILLRNNPKINLNRLLDYYNPKMIIADGSNAPWFTKRWEKSCNQKKIIFYDTRAEGALKITL